MLLSTDWFLPHWKMIGIGIADDKRAQIQLGCRGILDQMLAGCKDYYLSNISPERKDRTARKFRKLLKRAESEVEVSETLRTWESLSRIELQSANVYIVQTVALASGRSQGDDPALDPSIKSEVIRLWDQLQINTSALAEVSQQSGSEWDRFIAGILTGPQTLARVLETVLLGRSFIRLWAHLRENLSLQQVEELKSWHRTMTVRKLRLDEPRPLPALME